MKGLTVHEGALLALRSAESRRANAQATPVRHSKHCSPGMTVGPIVTILLNRTDQKNLLGLFGPRCLNIRACGKPSKRESREMSCCRAGRLNVYALLLSLSTTWQEFQ